MRRLRAGWVSFRRIHLAALIGDWRRTLLTVIGVALGVTVVLGVLILKSELARPFDSFGPSLTHAADSGVVEVLRTSAAGCRSRRSPGCAPRWRGAGSHPDRAAGLTPVDFGGNGTVPARPPARLLPARRVVPDRAAGRFVQLRTARP